MIPFCWDYSDDFLIPESFPELHSMAMGLNHTCIVKTDRNLHCFGDNEYGQVDVPFSVLYGDVVLVSAGNNHTCSTRRNTFRSIDCWGKNNYGQINIPLMILAKTSDVTHLYSGPNTTCVMIVKYEGFFFNEIKYSNEESIFCWGKDYMDFNVSDFSVTYIPLFDDKSQLSFGMGETICGVFDSVLSFRVNLYCWGRCSNNLCNVPRENKYQNTQVSVGDAHVCSIHGTLSCWGQGSHGQLHVPPHLARWAVSVAAGLRFTCMVTAHLTFACWGQVKHLNSRMRMFAKDIALGGRHSCAIRGGMLKCVGNDEYEQNAVPSLGLEVSALTHSQEVQAGWDYTCALDLELKLSCWGFNYLGQTDLPQNISSGEVANFSSGLSMTCAIYTNFLGIKKISCWGGSNYLNYNSFLKFYLNKDKVVVGDDHICVKSLSISCEGNNLQGQTDVPQLLSHIHWKSIRSLTAGGAHNCALVWDEYGKITCWGANGYGQSSIPPKIIISYYKISISAGVAHTCAIVRKREVDLNTEVVCWGLRVWQNLQMQEFKYPALIESGWDTDCTVLLSGEVACWGSEEDGKIVFDE